MCNSLTQIVIDEVVSAKIAANELFTALDVSLAVQGRLKASGDFDVAEHRHRYLKNDVHNAIDSLSSGRYDRQLRDVGAPVDAFVYYPQGSDPSTYVPLTRTDANATSSNPHTITLPPATYVASPPSIAAVCPISGFGAGATVVADPVVIPDPTTPDNTVPVDGRTPDARGTVCVPNFMLRNAGMVPGDKVNVYISTTAGKSCVVVAKQVPSGTSVTTSYTVDSHGNVRITNSVFVTTNTTAPKYSFQGNNNQVFVVPV